MLVIMLTMLFVVLVSVAVVAYVAFPHRGEDIPGAPWLGDAMKKGVEKLPTIEEDQSRDQFHV